MRCRRPAGKLPAYTCSAVHVITVTGRGESSSLSLSPLTSEGGEIKEEGGGSNKSDSVHSFVRSRNGPTAANTCIDFEDKSCTPNATRLSVIFHSASVKK